MAGGRVVVPDLAPPDKIRPFGVQSDTFAAPAPPPINNDYERLASALGQFSSAAMGAARRLEADAERERKKREGEIEAQANAKFLRWEMETGQPDQIKAYESGTAPISFVKEQLWKTHKAGVYGERFANTVGEKLRRGQVEGFGTEGFNPDSFVMEEARPYLDILGGDQTQLSAFASHFDSVGNLVRGKHAERLGAARIEHDETIALDTMGKAFRNSSNHPLLKDESPFDAVSPFEQLNLQRINRQLYHDMGPGTPLNITYSRLDELQLKMLDDAASDVRYAESVRTMLLDDREDVNGTGLNLGSFMKSAKHSDQAQAIFAKATRTLATAYQDEEKRKVRQFDVATFNRRDGTYFGLSDYTAPNPYDPANAITVDANTRKKEAAAAWKDAFRAANGGQADMPYELEVFAANNVKHPELAATLEGAFKGISSVTARAGDTAPDGIEAAANAYHMYQIASGMGHNYVEQTLLDEPTVKFYEAIRYGVEFMLLDEHTAAATVARLYATPEGRDAPHFSPEVMADIDARAQTTVQWGFFNDENNSNPNEVKGRIVRLATLYTQLGTAPDKAVERAAQRVNEQSVYINGRRTWGLKGLVNSDSKPVTDLLADIYKDQPKAVLETQGIKSPRDIRLVQGAEGQFHLVNKFGEPIIGASKKPLTMLLEDVGARRATIESVTRQLGLKAAEDHRESVRRAREEFLRREKAFRPN